MNIKTLDEAKHWAAAYLGHNYVLVDETGNIYCCNTAEDLAKVGADREGKGAKIFVVKGTIATKPTTQSKQDEPK